MIIVAFASLFLIGFAIALLIVLGVTLLQQTFEGRHWIQRERDTQEGRQDVIFWKEKRRHRTMRNDILWGAEREEAHQSLQNIFRAEHNRKERLEANQNALLEVDEDWMREAIQKDILALAPRKDYFQEVWDAQSNLEQIEEAEVYSAESKHQFLEQCL